jgi:hypothetical protein
MALIVSGHQDQECLYKTKQMLRQQQKSPDNDKHLKGFITMKVHRK